MSRDALVVGINKYPFLKDSQTGNYKHLTTLAADAEAIAIAITVQWAMLKLRFNPAF